MKKSISIKLITLVLVIAVISTAFVGFITMNVKAADTTITFEQSKANFYLDYASYDTFRPGNYNIPYRTIVEHNRNNTTYKNLINAWQATTFELSDVLDYSDRRKGYYETFLFDILYSDFDTPDVFNDLNKAYKSTQVSLIKQLNKWDKWELYNGYDISNLTDDQTETLAKELQSCSELKGVLSKASFIGKVLKYANDIEDLIYKLAKCSVISKLGNEYVDILNLIADTSSGSEMKYACREVAAICSGVWDESTALYVFTSEAAFKDLFEFFLDEIWSGIIEKCSGYGIAIQTGQKAGKFIANLLWSIDKEVENYYEMDALYDFETELRKAVTYYENSYRNNTTTENAKRFTAAYEMLFGVYKLGCDISIEHARIIHDIGEDGMTGFANLFVTNVSGNRDKLNQYYNNLNSVKDNIDNIREMANDGVYEAWVNGYCFDLKDQYNMPPVTHFYTSADYQERLSSLEFYAFATGDVTIGKNWTLDRNYYTVGDLTINSASVDLNGYSLLAEGEMRINNSTITINGGTLSANNNTVFNGITVNCGNSLNEVSGIFVNGNLSISGNNNRILSGTNVTIDGNTTYVSPGKILTIESGANLTVNGDLLTNITSQLVQGQGAYIALEGSLTVNGDIDLQQYPQYYIYRYIEQSSESSYLKVNGNIVNLYLGQTTAGTIEVTGNVNTIGTMSGSSKMILCGDQQQSITSLNVDNIVFKNQSEQGVNISNRIYVNKSIENKTSKITNGQKIYLYGNVVDTYTGDITIIGNTRLSGTAVINGNVQISGNNNKLNPNVQLTVNGDMIFLQSSSLEISSDAKMIVNGNVISNEWWSTVILNGELDVNGNINLTQAPSYQAYGVIKQTTDGSKLYVNGNIVNLYLGQTTAGTIEVTGNVNTIGTMSGSSKCVLKGSGKQEISYLAAPTIIIENQSSDGVTFLRTISVPYLFDHKGNYFSLYNNGNGSSFVDYDGDGLKDNVDPYPTVGNPCIITVSVDDSNHGLVNTDQIDTNGGSEVTVSATPCYYYNFDKWIDETGNPISTSNPYSFIVKDDKNLTALFSEREDMFVGHSLSLNGDIGVNYYVDVDDEDVNNGKVKVNFAWNVEGTEKNYSVTLSSNDKYDFGYRASCPVPVAEMTYDITATITIDGIALSNTDTYSVQKYAKSILNNENNFREKYIAAENGKGHNGEQRYIDLVTLVQTMLDYGTKAQVVFNRDTEHPANDGTDYYSDETNPVLVDMITVTEENMDMDLSVYGLRYKGSTVVYLSETSIRHYYYVDDWDSFNRIKDSVTFDGVAVTYTEKDDAIYFEKKGVSASNLDTPYTLTIKDKSCKFAVNDYIRRCLESNKVSDNTKALVKATYRYNVAANAFFEV